MFLSTAAVRNLRPNFDHDHPRYMIYHQDTGSGVHVHAVEMYPRVAPIVGSTQVLKIGDLGKVSDCVFEGTVGSLVFWVGRLWESWVAGTSPWQPNYITGFPDCEAHWGHPTSNLFLEDWGFCRSQAHLARLM